MLFNVRSATVKYVESLGSVVWEKFSVNAAQAFWV